MGRKAATKPKPAAVEPKTVPAAVVSIDDLSPDAANVRRHPERNRKAIEASLRQFGAGRSIVLDGSNVVRAGNGTIEAARALGFQEVVVIEPKPGQLVAVKRPEWGPTEATSYAIADNRTAELAEWDELELAKQLEAIDAEGGLQFTGFDDTELRTMLDKLARIALAEVTEDEPEPEPAAGAGIVTRPGDVWILGRHRITCGDSTRQDDTEKALAGELADIVFTDPPYGVNIEGSKINNTIAGDLTQTAIPFSFELAVTVATKPEARLYFCGGESNIGIYAKLFERHLRQLPRHLIWVKNNFCLTQNGYHKQYELIYHGYKPGGGAKKHWYSGRTMEQASDVWAIDRDAGQDYEHPTQKPVAIPARAISNSCPKGGLVWEPFCGSGSTLIAAEQLDRVCYAMEIEPRFVDVAVRRWQRLTGRDAYLDGSNQTFREIESGGR